MSVRPTIHGKLVGPGKITVPDVSLGGNYRDSVVCRVFPSRIVGRADYLCNPERESRVYFSPGGHRCSKCSIYSYEQIDIKELREINVYSVNPGF